MRRGEGAILVFTLVVLLSSVVCAQKPPSLEEQLRAQYEPGTVLTIQKAGILGVAPASNKICPAKYQDGKINPPELSCAASLTSGSRILTVGEKINPSEIDVDLARERISFSIVECDSCNKVTQASSYQSQIDFQFAKGYLGDAGVSGIVDTISEVLAFPEVAVEQPAQTPNPPEQAGSGSDGVLTNNDVIKMVKVKLGDGIIISKIKASPCSFDTSVDTLVKLKEAGVSDPVIQAMHDAQQTANVVENASTPALDSQSDAASGPAPIPGGVSFSVRHRHSAFAQNLFSQSSKTEYYCSGTLSASPDGTVAYNCAQTDDPSGRCEHVSFAPGSLKQVKIGLAGNLHLESKTQGKFDFYGRRDDIKQAQAAIAPLIQTTQK